MSIRLGAFELCDPLGEGAMGRVWSSRGPGGMRAAVKVITAESELGTVHAEIRAAAALRHPGVVAIYDRGRVDARAAGELGVREGAPWLAMEQLDGTLRDARGLDGLDVIRQLLDALAHAHARQVIHRDLKPSNVLHDGRGRIRVADFGLAHFVGQGGERARAGSPAYVSPEQLRGEWRDFGPWTDLYALGCVACELLTGRRPFDGTPTELIQAHLTAAPRLPAELDPHLARWIRRCLAKEPRARFQFAREAAAALAGSRSAATVPLAPTAAPTFDWTDSAFDVGENGSAEPVGSVRIGVPPSWPEPADPADPGVGIGLWGLREIALVGRSEHRQALWNGLRDAIDSNEPRAFLLHGEAGTGKTRLAHILTQVAHEHACAWVLQARFSDVPGPDVGLAGLIARDLQIHGLDPARRSRRVVRELEAMGEHDSDEQYILEEIAAGSASRLGRSERLAVIARHLARRAATGPVVVWLDDLQHGAEGVELVQWVLGRVSAPILFVATLRGDDPDTTRAFERAGGTAIEVPPLTEDEHLELVRRLAGLEPDIARQVARRTAGHPLFAVQLVDDWVRRGLLVSEGGATRLVEGAAVPIPDTLHGLRQRRLEHALGDREVRAIEVAALLGDAFDPDEWRAVLQTCGVAEPPDLLEALADARLIVWDPGTARWQFVHGMLRESIDRAAGSARVAWHDAIATWLSENGGSAERVGRHLLLANRPVEALPVLLRAAENLLMMGRFEASKETVHLAQRAVEAGNVDELDHHAIDLERRKARLLGFSGHFSQLIDQQRTVLERARRAGNRAMEAQLSADLADSLIMGSAPDEGWKLYENAVALAGEIEDRRVTRDVRLWYGFRLANHGRFDEARAVLEPLENRAITGELGLACVATFDGRFEDAERHLDAAEAASARNRRGLTNVHSARADLALQRNDYPGARKAYAEALRLHRALGTGDAELMRVNLSLVDALAGEYARARPVLQWALAELEARDRMLDASFCKAGLLLCDIGEGRLPSPWLERVDHAARVHSVGPDGLILMRAGADRTTDPLLRKKLLELELDVHERVGNRAKADQVAALIRRGR